MIEWKDEALKKGINSFFKWVEWYYRRHLESEVFCDVYTEDDKQFSELDEDIKNMIIDYAKKFKDIIKPKEDK